MLGADYSERGGLAASRATSAVHSPADLFPSHSPATQGQPSTSLDDTDSSTWSSLGQLTANTSTTNLSPNNPSHIAASNTKLKNNDIQSSNLDLSTPDSQARDELLRNSTFADWDDHGNASTDLDSPDELQKQDPLGTQIWKLYSRTKSRLPNQERMENLTWRMMAMNLRRREQQIQAQAQAAYEKQTQPGSDLRQAGADSLLSAKQTKIKSPPQVSAPSGIAQQLRRSVDQPVELELTSEPMNLDDFIVPSSIASPAGITSPAPTEGLIQSKVPQGSANIRITPRNKPSVQIPMNLPPSSMPQTSVALNRSSEFDYVQRRVRKTSIDERRGVSFDCLLLSIHVLTACDRTASDLLNSHLKSLPLLYPRVLQGPRSTRVSQITPLTNPPLPHFPINTISKAKCLSI